MISEKESGELSENRGQKAVTDNAQASNFFDMTCLQFFIFEGMIPAAKHDLPGGHRMLSQKSEGDHKRCCLPKSSGHLFYLRVRRGYPWALSFDSLPSPPHISSWLIYFGFRLNFWSFPFTY